MNRLTWIIAGLLVAASVVMTVGIERHSANQQIAQTEALEEQKAQIAQASMENARLTNLVASASPSPPLSPEQFKELIRLRNEVGQLHKVSDQKAWLEATNAQLRARDAKSQETLAAARALPNYWPKEQLAFAGYADPDSTIKSMLTAMKNGDLKALTNCFDPASAPDLDAEMKRDGGDPAAKKAEIMTELTDFVAPADGFHIQDQTWTAPDETTIYLSFDGEGLVQKFVLRKYGDDWKLAGGN